MTRVGAVLLAAVIFTLWGNLAIADVEVSSCGQIWTGAGHLSRNLLGCGVTIEGHGRLDLRGFSLGGISCDAKWHSGPDVWVGGFCTIVGPGTVGGTNTWRRIKIRNVSVTGHIDVGYGGIKLDNCSVGGGLSNDFGKVLVRDSTIIGGGGAGIDTYWGAVSVIRSTISGHAGRGVQVLGRGKRVRIVDSVITGNGGDGVYNKTDGAVSVVRSDISDNGGTGVQVSSIYTENYYGSVAARIRSSTISRNGGAGVSARLVAVTASTITDNASYGVVGREGMHASSSEITGNGTCDVQCGKLPNLNRHTTCDTSCYLNLGGSWGICALD